MAQSLLDVASRHQPELVTWSQLWAKEVGTRRDTWGSRSPDCPFPAPFSHLLRPLPFLRDSGGARAGEGGLREAVVGTVRPGGRGPAPGALRSRAGGGVGGRPQGSGPWELGRGTCSTSRQGAALKRAPRKLRAYRQPGGKLPAHLRNVKLFRQPRFCVSNPQSLGEGVTRRPRPHAAAKPVPGTADGLTVPSGPGPGRRGTGCLCERPGRVATAALTLTGGHAGAVAWDWASVAARSGVGTSRRGVGGLVSDPAVTQRGVSVL